MRRIGPKRLPTWLSSISSCIGLESGDGLGGGLIDESVMATSAARADGSDEISGEADSAAPTADRNSRRDEGIARMVIAKPPRMLQGRDAATGRQSVVMTNTRWSGSVSNFLWA